MKRLMASAMCCAVLAVGFGCAQDTPEPEGSSMAASPGEVFITNVLSCVDHTGTLLDIMAAAADDAASRIVDGGKIYVMDDETIERTGDEEVKLLPGGDFQYPMHEDWGGFVAEACDRAGGLRHIQPVPLQGTLTEKDVVIVGTIGLDEENQYAQLKIYRDAGALIIAFGSKDAKIMSLADHVIDNGLDAGIVPVMDVGKGEKIGPVAGIANVINKWVFTAEYVAAVTRQGEMPTLWQSMFVPGAAERNEKIGEYMFHPDMRIMPVEPGLLGAQYIDAVKSYLTKIKANELPKFREAGLLLSDTLDSDNKIVAGIIGHFMSSQRRMPGFPKGMFNITENEYGTDQQKNAGLSEGDVWFHIGYSMYPERELKYAREIGAKTVCVFTPGPTDIGEGTPIQPDMSLLDVYIDPYWTHGDAVVEVPDYDTKVLPPSGVVMSTCYWMIIGETLNAQAGR